MSVKAAGIPEGPHGMHFHVKASCIAPNFKSAGGHINAMGMEHGLKNPNGPDNADMPNAVADANNTLNLKVTNDRVSLNGTDNLPALLDADGSALVIHANADDQMTQPIGGAGWASCRLSSTVRPGMMRRSSGTNAMPSAAAWWLFIWCSGL